MNQVDFDFVGSFLFATPTGTQVDPAEMVPVGDPDLDGLADAPPPISGYREANVQGMACWNCGHFTPVGDWDDDGDVDGICNLFEAKAEGECTCDRFTAHADLLRQAPHTSWTEDVADQLVQAGANGPSVTEVDYADGATLNEIFLSGTAIEEDGLVWKDILRTGEWKQTPTNKGVIDRALRITRDGESDPAKGVISLSEIYSNFQDRAVPYVTIPLSDDVKDHKNIARLNTGFVRKLKIVDRDGLSILKAGMEFTEPDVKEKVLRGTIPDCSAGIPFGVTRRKDKKFFRTVLDHVCLTAKPFIDGLSPFGLAAANDDAELPVEAWEAEAEVVEPQRPGANSETPALSYVEQQKAIAAALRDQLRLASDYGVEDINQASGQIVVRHSVSGTRWAANYKLTGDNENPVLVASVNNWKIIEEQAREQEAVAASDPSITNGLEAVQSALTSNSDSELHRARELRELRLSQPTSNIGGIQMPPLTLDGVELSNLNDEARARIQSIVDENARLARTSREGMVNERIRALEGDGLKDRPGALRLYRDVMLSDDGGPAIVLFADDPDSSKRKSLTTLEVLDQFIEALKADGGVSFSDQALQSGNDNKPPADASGEAKPLEERVAEARTALYGKGKRTGRK